MREFGAAVKRVVSTEADEPQKREGKVVFPVVKWDVDGKEIGRRMVTAYPPDDGQFAYLLMGVNRRSPMREQIATAMNFLMAIIPDNEDAQHLADRLLDPTDEFGVAAVRDIIEYLVEEWSGRPTQSPSGSASSEPNGGPSSTEPTPMSTSSASPSIVI